MNWFKTLLSLVISFVLNISHHINLNYQFNLENNCGDSSETWCYFTLMHYGRRGREGKAAFNATKMGLRYGLSRKLWSRAVDMKEAGSPATSTHVCCSVFHASLPDSGTGWVHGRFRVCHSQAHRQLESKEIKSMFPELSFFNRMTQQFSCSPLRCVGFGFIP